MSLAHDISKGKRTQDIKTTQDVTFDTMLLSDVILQGLKCSGFIRPSPIQLHGIPLGKCGFDLLLEAKSGTGKTAVFTIIALEKLDRKKGLQTVILAPTREIAAQICDVLKAIGSEYKDLVVEVVMGGLPVQEDIEKFKVKNRVHVLVGSPGRLRHLIQDKHIDVSSVRLLVLDEADKLMEKSFQSDINYIFSALPKAKQVIMSSATYPDSARNFIENYVKNSQHVCPDTTSILLGIEQKVTLVEYNPNILKQTKYRYKELTNILSKHKFKQCLIFCNYQVRVGELHKMLSKDEWPSAQLFGMQVQTDRLDALKTLQEYKCRILIATDLAARGIDASNVDLVINFEPPYEWETYLHRIGRAGRYGSYGMAVTVLSKGDEEKKFKVMLNAMKHSLNIVDMWSNEKFLSGDQDLTNDVKDVQEEKPIKTETVWKELNSSGGEDFQTLPLNTFENLLTDFEQWVEGCETNDEGNDDTYKHLSLEEIDVSDPDLSETPDKGLKSDESTPKIKLEDSFDLKNNSFKKTVIGCKYVDNKRSLNGIVSDHDNRNKISHKTYEESLVDEMKMLGLPTTFGAKKCYSSDKQNKHIDNERYNSESECDDVREEALINKHKRHSRKASNIVTKRYVKAECNNINNYETHGWRCRDHETKTKRSAKVRHTSSDSGQHSSRSSNSYNDYLMWYQQLKMRTKQIELAYYIEEMSRV